MARTPACHPLTLGVITDILTCAAIAALALQSASVARETVNRAPVIAIVGIRIAEDPITQTPQ